MLQKILSVAFTLFAFIQSSCSQGSAANRLGHCQSPRFDREVGMWLSFKVPTIDVDSLRNAPQNVLILDAREPAEYAVSHIPGAVQAGFDHFNVQQLDSLDKNRPVVVYCSIGYRSEKIANQLKKAGFTQVSNLYGSIFEWVNRGYPLEDETGQPTHQIHTFNRMWGRWVTNADYQKVTSYREKK